MATAASEPGSGALLGRPRNSVKLAYEHLFSSGMALLILGTVVLGFARTYYFAGVFRAPLPSWVIHGHGAVFSTWILLLIVQTSLISAGRVEVHRRFGVIGFVLACLMLVLGTCAATDALRRGVTDVGTDAQTFYSGNILEMMAFGTLVGFAYRLRRNPRCAQTGDFASDNPADGRANFPLALQHLPASTCDLYWRWVVCLATGRV